MSWKTGHGGAAFFGQDVRLGPHHRVLGVQAFPMMRCREWLGGGSFLHHSFGCIRVFCTRSSNNKIHDIKKK